MSRRRRTLIPRDQATTAFGSTLMRLCDGTGALGAALVDRVGETVDYAGYAEPFALRVMAAEWRIVLDVIRSIPHAGYEDAQELRVRAAGKTFALIGLAEGYALVLELPRRCFEFSRRALAEAAREIELESGLPASHVQEHDERWSKIEVRTVAGNRRRPEAIWLEGTWQPVLVMGRYVRLRSRREVGFRARLLSGLEFALVREPLGIWFAGGL